MDEKRKKAIGNKLNSLNSGYNNPLQNDYRTAITVSMLVSSIGWIGVVAGIGLSVWLLDAGEMAMLGIPSAIAVTLVGLLLVVAGQASRAVMDNANYSKQMLDEMRKQ